MLLHALLAINFLPKDYWWDTKSEDFVYGKMSILIHLFKDKINFTSIGIVDHHQSAIRFKLPVFPYMRGDGKINPKIGVYIPIYIIRIPIKVGMTISNIGSLKDSCTNNLRMQTSTRIEVCIFAYGQTGSGKTFTMTGTDANPGAVGHYFWKWFVFDHLEEGVS